MADIVLTTLNAKYIHAAFGLRYLAANLGALQSRAAVLEFDINQRPMDVVERLLARAPKIIGFGVYIWNVATTSEIVAALKRIRPDLIIILGGPEVSYETETQPVVQLADYVITGEADLKFGEICRDLLAGVRPGAKIISAELPDFNRLKLPYDLYDEQDVAHRIIYVEASRGCPFTCEFCLSSLDIPVRQVPLPELLQHLQRLLERGVKQFKFVDRTFNLNMNVSRAILEFFLERYQPGCFFHFEMIPDRLPEALRELIKRFPRGALQFEVGIQTFTPEVEALIQRRQHHGRLEDNLRFLRRETGVHIHADLIAGLPGETLESFGEGFDRLIGLEPQEIQVGILKRLRGTPIVRHDADWQMVYNPEPPYEILQNKLLDFATLQRLKRFARYWDLIGNSGNFVETAPLIWATPSSSVVAQEQVSITPNPSLQTVPLGKSVSPFRAFWLFSNWLHERIGRTDGVALVRLMELLFDFLLSEVGLESERVASSLWRDYQRGGRSDVPLFLRDCLPARATLQKRIRKPASAPRRQARHLGLA